jgi:hypothetical protein
MSDRKRSDLTDAKTKAGSAGIVVVTLAAGQFLMTLDRSFTRGRSSSRSCSNTELRIQTVTSPRERGRHVIVRG